MEVEHRLRPLGIEMRLAKPDQHLGKVPQSESLMRRLSSFSPLAHEAQLEPEPVLSGLSDARDVATSDLDAADELVEGVLVGVRSGGEVADALVVLAQEAIPQQLGQSARALVSSRPDRLRAFGRRTDGPRSPAKPSGSPRSPSPIARCRAHSPVRRRAPQSSDQSAGDSRGEPKWGKSWRSVIDAK